MNRLRVFVLAHLILGPLGIYILAEDMKHPEWWDIWYRNPYISIPFLIADDAFILGGIVYLSRQDRWNKGTQLLQEAIRLEAAGNHEAAEAAYQEGVRLTGLKRQ